MSVKEAVYHVDADYEDCAKRLGLEVSADYENTSFLAVSKSGRFKFDALIPNRVSDESYFSIQYNSLHDQDSLEAISAGIGKLVNVRDELKTRHGQQWVSSNIDDGVEITYEVKLSSHSQVVPHLESIFSCFPRNF